MENVLKQKFSNGQKTIGAFVESCSARPAAHPGVDGIFTGPYDLSIAMGMPGEFDRPEFQAALDRIVTACHENHKFCIIYAGVIENAAASFKRGYDSVAHNVDTAILIEAYRDRVAQLRSMI